MTGDERYGEGGDRLFDDRPDGRLFDDPGNARPAEPPPRGEPDDDLFVWRDLRPPARAADRPAEPPLRDRRSPEYATGAGPAGPEPPPDGYEVEEEWEEWLEPGGPRGPESPGLPPGRGRPPRRRRASAGAVLLALLLGFFLAGLLDAKALETEARARPFGSLRSLQLAMLKPMTGLSGLLRLDRPALALNDLLGRGEVEHHTLADVKPAKKSLWPRTITKKKPLRLYVAGDSMNQVFGSSLVNLAEATKLVKGKNDYHVSSGLSRPDFYDWPQRLVDQIVEFKPDAAAVLFGANDGQDVYYKGKVLKVGTKAWQEVYAKRVGKAMDILAKGGRRVYWVGNPIMKDFGYRERIAMMNHIYQAEAEKRPGVMFVSTWAALANEKGSYAEYLKDESGGKVLMRAPDGIHLTRAGGDRMAQVVLDAIMKDWDMGASGSSGADPDAP